jgi:signal transduction histidine kinase
MAASEHGDLPALAAHLRQRREALLADWRRRVDADPLLTSNKRLGHRAIEDHIPQALESFERHLGAEHALGELEAGIAERTVAIRHAEQRWRYGYEPREMLREWAHLYNALLQEMRDFSASHHLNGSDLWIAVSALGDFIMEGVCEGGARYADFQKADAAARVRALRESLDELQALEDERANLLRQAAHDLRGSTAVVANISALLEKQPVDGPERQRFYGLLQRRIQAMGALLTQMMSWARLQTEEDPLQIESLDAVERVASLCELMRPSAQERGLYLHFEGPPSLVVETDALKLQRILQNLLLNAIRATERGGITVRVEMLADAAQWRLSIQDTGPGFDPAAVRSKPSTASNDPAISSSEPPSGEGIGLMIVERLCAMLKAKLTFQSTDGGTTVCITLALRSLH